MGTALSEISLKNKVFIVKSKASKSKMITNLGPRKYFKVGNILSFAILKLTTWNTLCFSISPSCIYLVMNLFYWICVVQLFPTTWQCSCAIFERILSWPLNANIHDCHQKTPEDWFNIYISQPAQEINYKWNSHYGFCEIHLERWMGTFAIQTVELQKKGGVVLENGREWN